MFPESLMSLTTRARKETANNVPKWETRQGTS